LSRVDSLFDFALVGAAAPPLSNGSSALFHSHILIAVPKELQKKIDDKLDYGLNT